MTDTRHEELLEKAKEAIDELFGDTSVSQERTLESLEDLAGIIAMNCASLRADMRKVK